MLRLIEKVKLIVSIFIISVTYSLVKSHDSELAEQSFKSYPLRRKKSAFCKIISPTTQSITHTHIKNSQSHRYIHPYKWAGCRVQTAYKLSSIQGLLAFCEHQNVRLALYPKWGL
jgi:hypothetical protein